MSVSLAYIALLSLLSINAIAQPAISNLQLSKSSNELTTLSGSGFGSFEGKVLGWDDFDSYPLAAPLPTLKNPAGNTWSAGGDSTARLDTHYAQSGSQSVKLEWPPGKASSGFFGWMGKTPVHQLYISYWRRMEANGISSASNHQQLYIAGKDARKPPQFSLGVTGADSCWTLTSSLIQTSNLSQKHQTKASLADGTSCGALTTGKFQHWEFTIDLKQAGLDARLDGMSIFNISEPTNIALSGITEIRFGYQSGGFNEVASSWFDDVYIATSQARVEACTSPVYANCKRRHLQYVAPENWSNNQIQFRLHNLRMFRGEPIYLYVIDAQGRVSNGIAIARPVMKAN